MVYLTPEEKEHKEGYLAGYPAWLVRLYRRRRSLSDVYVQAASQRVLPGMLILDLGAGKKGFMSLLAERKVRTVGLDMSVDALRQNRELTYKVCADAAHLPFRAGVFDGVSSQWLLEHLPQPAVFIKEVARILKPSGFFLLVSNSVYCPFMLFNAVMPEGIRDWMKKRWLPVEVDEDTFPTYYRANSRRTLRRLARHAGLQELDFGFYSDLSFFIFNRAIFTAWLLLDLLTTHLLRPLRMHFIGVYEKRA